MDFSETMSMIKQHFLKVESNFGSGRSDETTLTFALRVLLGWKRLVPVPGTM